MKTRKSLKAKSLKAKSLEDMRIFGSLDAAEIATLNLRCHWRQIRPKEWLLHQDHVDTDAYFLTDGALRMIISTPGGSDVILSDLKAGDYFGEMPAIDGQPQPAGIVAISDATVACMPASVFRQVLHEHPEVMERVLRDFVSRMRSLHQRVSELHTMPVRDRIYAELLRRSRADPFDERRTVISPVPRHAELAARVGTRRETVARELKALERAGIFTKSKGAFLITDREIEPKLQPRRRAV
jgi:CRP/FNR family cyclic AMP-dependent transcriptional regulator